MSTQHGRDIHLADLYEGDFFGEMAVFENGLRSSTVRSRGPSTILTIDHKTLMKRMQDDPSLAFRIVRRLSSRIRDVDKMVSRIQASDRRKWDKRPEDDESKIAS